MRVWVDLTNSPHVLVMRPVIELLRRDGHEVEVTARDFAQTLPLLARQRLDHTAIGRHRGERVLAKGAGLASRSAALVRWARRRAPFDVALGHGSNDVSVAAALLGVPSATTFDYEFAVLQHHINCRLARVVLVPDAIPPERLRSYGAAGKIRTYAGLKEEYYLADFRVDPTVLEELGLEADRTIVVVRTPPDVSLYHRFASPLFADLLGHLLRRASAEGVQVVVFPRTESQRAELQDTPGFLVPEVAVDAQSLIASADLVISAGGTMNREAVALGTPVWSTFEGRIGALDERLITQGRLRRLVDPAQLDLSRRARGADDSGERVRRDPRLLAEQLLSAVAR